MDSSRRVARSGAAAPKVPDARITKGGMAVGSEVTAHGARDGYWTALRRQPRMRWSGDGCAAEGAGVEAREAGEAAARRP